MMSKKGRSEINREMNRRFNKTRLRGVEARKTAWAAARDVIDGQLERGDPVDIDKAVDAGLRAT